MYRHIHRQLEGVFRTSIVVAFCDADVRGCRRAAVGAAGALLGSSCLFLIIMAGLAWKFIHNFRAGHLRKHVGYGDFHVHQRRILLETLYCDRGSLKYVSHAHFWRAVVVWWALRELITCKNIFVLGDGSARFKFCSPFWPHGLLPQWGSCHILLQ